MEKKDLEKALLECEAHRNAVVEGFPGVLIFFDRDLKVQWSNHAAESLFPDVIGKECHEIFYPESSRCDFCVLNEALFTEKIESDSLKVAVEGEKESVFDVIVSPVKDLAGEVSGWVLTAQNVTEKYNLEKQLRHVQKMEAIGTLAGGVAHDFNNVLTPIMGYTEIIRLKLKNDKYEEQSVFESLGEILKAAKRAQSLVQQVLVFSRTSEKKAEPQYLHLIIKEVVKLVKATSPKTIRICEDIDESCGQVMIDPVQIHQVVINLCTNAFQSIGADHGELKISLKKGATGKYGSEWLELSVADTGKGIAPEMLERIFEPYFSTREKTSSTGMGLAVVHGIVTHSGGQIEVESQPGQGTVFRVYLPLADKEEDVKQVLAYDRFESGSGRILLVDDEEQIVQVIGEILRNLGYTVSGFSSAVKALDEFSKKPLDFDLILSDLMMPDLTGMELSEKITSIREDIPVILLTGYSEKLAKDVAREKGVYECCMKPISMQQLSEVVAKVLNKTR